MSFDRVLRVVLGVIGLTESRSFRGAYYNTRRISRALKTPPTTRREHQARNDLAIEPESHDDLCLMVSWLIANVLGQLSPKQRGFVKNMDASLKNGRKPSLKQEQWLRSIYSKHNQAGN